MNCSQYELLHVIKNSDQNAQEMCTLLLGENCSNQTLNKQAIWEVPLPPVNQKVKTVNHNSQEAKTVEINSHYINEKPQLKVLQITDIHYDPKYKEGALADCKEPLCCRDKPRVSKFRKLSNSSLAGKYGDYRHCDTPMITIDSMIDHIKKEHKVGNLIK